MSELAFHDDESCDRCGARGCVRRPICLVSGEALEACWDCYQQLDEDDRVDHLGRPGPSPNGTDLEEFNPVGCDEFALADPSNPRAAYLHAENAAKLDDWR